MGDDPGRLSRNRIVAALADPYRSIVTARSQPTSSNPGDIEGGKGAHGYR